MLVLFWHGQGCMCACYLTLHQVVLRPAAGEMQQDCLLSGQLGTAAAHCQICHYRGDPPHKATAAPQTARLKSHNAKAGGAARPLCRLSAVLGLAHAALGELLPLMGAGGCASVNLHAFCLDCARWDSNREVVANALPQRHAQSNLRLGAVACIRG